MIQIKFVYWEELPSDYMRRQLYNYIDLWCTTRNIDYNFIEILDEGIFKVTFDYKKYETLFLLTNNFGPAVKVSCYD